MLTLLSRAICHVKCSMKYAVLVCLSKQSKLESRQKTRKEKTGIVAQTFNIGYWFPSYCRLLLLKGESENERKEKNIYPILLRYSMIFTAYRLIATVLVIVRVSESQVFLT